MPPQTRPRARSSVEHLFDLVESLEEDQLQSFLEEINSTPHANIDVSSGVAYFEEQRRQQAAAAHHNRKQLLRPTPSFINATPEPKDWPRQKPRPVSGSQWRESMRIVSAPYARHTHGGAGGAGAGVDEPVSPPLTASPPASPPAAAMGPRRSVTAPVGKMEVRVEARQVEAPSPVSPPRHMLDDDDDDDDDVDDDDDQRPTFGAFRFGGDGAADNEAQQSTSTTSSSSAAAAAVQSRPVSPAAQQSQPQPHHAARITPPPEQPFPEFTRMDTMPPLHHTPLSFDAAAEESMRPRTSAGPLAPTRAFRRVSRPVFLSPVEGTGAEELAGRLSAFLFGGGAAQKQQQQSQFLGRKAGPQRRSVLMEEMLKEPGTPRGRAVFGKGEDEGVPVSGIFEVLTKG